MKTIKLTQGKCTLVSNIDYTYLNQWKWFIVRSKKNWYAARRDNKYKVIFIHHVILNRIGKHNFIYVDHRDGDGLNNCRSNLRPATKSQNGGNRGLNKNNKSGYKGVHWETCTKK